MYAIIKVGHRQFKVRAGTILRITSFLQSDKGKKFVQFPVAAAEEGKGIVLGKPLIQEAKVTATVLREGRTKKILVFKKKRRKGYRRTKGHRQNFIEVEISEIKFPSGKIDKAMSKEKRVLLAKSKKISDEKTQVKAKKTQTKKTKKG